MSNRALRMSSCGEMVADLFLTVDIECREPSPCLRIVGTAFGQQVNQRIDIVARPQPLGGERYYAICPLTEARCLTLVLPPDECSFASPRGWQVPYTSTRERGLDRALRRADKLRSRLAGLSKYTRRPRREQIAMRFRAAEAAIDIMLADSFDIWG